MPYPNEVNAPRQLEDQVFSRVSRIDAARERMNSVVVGQERVIDELLLAMVAGGHVLLEGAPGVGKTLLVRTLAEVCGLRFSRIQFTPDLMPADITGANVLLHDEHGHTASRFEPGPIFGQLVLADEINRATPKTQSALLEAMQEGTVTAGGAAHELPRPFLVMATQNPIEMEGTYNLPEAQLDRFFLKAIVGFPDDAAMESIIDQSEPAATTHETLLRQDDLEILATMARRVHVPTSVKRFVLALVSRSQPASSVAPDLVQRFMRFGISPRAAQFLVMGARTRALLKYRFNASLEDVRELVAPILRHSLHLNFAAAAEHIDQEHVLDAMLEGN